MELNDYQEKTKETAVYTHPVIYPGLGLAGEAGEVANIVKKALRDNHLDKDRLKDELGDVLWYVARLAGDLEFTLEEIAEFNLDKLRRRYIE